MMFECIDRSEQETRLFLRDDDIDIVEDTLADLLDICRGHHVPISLAVIPGRLTEDCAAYVRARQSRDPHLIEVHQHGWLHANHEPLGKKCEFGASRSLEQQRADIAAGKARMDEAFAGDWFPAFTPPWNRYTLDTRRALEEMRFSVLSADGCVRSGTAGAIRELPVTLDIYRWKERPALRPRVELTRELAAQIERRQTIGILLHHKVMDGDAFDLLDSLLGELRRHQSAGFHTLRSLAEASSRESAYAP